MSGVKYAELLPCHWHIWTATGACWNTSYHSTFCHGSHRISATDSPLVCCYLISFTLVKPCLLLEMSIKKKEKGFSPLSRTPMHSGLEQSKAHKTNQTRQLPRLRFQQFYVANAKALVCYTRKASSNQFQPCPQ